VPLVGLVQLQVGCKSCLPQQHFESQY